MGTKLRGGVGLGVLVAVALVRCVSGDDSTTTDSGLDGTTSDSAADVVQNDGGPKDATSDGDGGPTCVVPDSGAHGSLDNSFSTAALTSITNGFAATAIAIDGTGRVYVGGQASGGSCGTLDFALVRLTSDGNVDTTFNVANAPKCYSLDATAGAINAVYAMAIDSQGRVVMGGISGHANHYFASVARVDDKGALDTSFNGTGLVDVLGADAGIAAGNGNGFVTIYGVAIAAGDKVVITGTDDNGGSNAPWKAGYVARLTSGGALDIGFATGGLYTDPSVHGYWGVTVDANDAITTIGYDKGAPNRMVVRRLNSSGAPDGTFGTDGGLVTLPTFVDGGGTDVGRSLLHLPNGNLLAAGAVNASNLAGGTGVAMLQSNGALQSSFAGGQATYPNLQFFAFYMTSALASLCDGTMFVAGAVNSNPNQDIAIAKILPNGTLDPTFGGDAGLAVIAVAGNQLPAQMAQDPITGKLVVVGGTGGQTVVARFNP